MTRIALVGCGRIAVRHADLLSNAAVPGAELAAVCDTIPERARGFGYSYKVPYFAAIDDMMAAERDRIDVVSVLTPSGLHAEHVIDLARFGKHIIVEKPMALTLESADDMIRACYENNVRLFVVKQNRFNVPVQQLKSALDAGRFGKVVLGTVRVRWCRRQEYYDQDSWRGTWANDGGVLANQASHHIDLLQWMLGDVQTVYAQSRTALVRIEAEDTAVAILQFKNGAMGVVEATTATRPHDLEGSLSILGERGSAVIGGFAVNQMNTWQFEDELPEDEDTSSKCSVVPPNVYGFGHQAYYAHVLECLSGGSRALVDGIEGRKSVELIAAMYESIETSQPVEIRFRPKRCRLGMKS